MSAVLRALEVVAWLMFNIAIFSVPNPPAVLVFGVICLWSFSTACTWIYAYLRCNESIIYHKVKEMGICCLCAALTYYKISVIFVDALLCVGHYWSALHPYLLAGCNLFYWVLTQWESLPPFTYLWLLLETIVTIIFLLVVVSLLALQTYLALLVFFPTYLLNEGYPLHHLRYDVRRRLSLFAWRHFTKRHPEPWEWLSHRNVLQRRKHGRVLLKRVEMWFTSRQRMNTVVLAMWSMHTCTSCDLYAIPFRRLPPVEHIMAFTLSLLLDVISDLLTHRHTMFLVFLMLIVTGNIHPNPGPSFEEWNIQLKPFGLRMLPRFPFDVGDCFYQAIATLLLSKQGIVPPAIEGVHPTIVERASLLRRAASQHLLDTIKDASSAQGYHYKLQIWAVKDSPGYEILRILQKQRPHEDVAVLFAEALAWDLNTARSLPCGLPNCLWADATAMHAVAVVLQQPIRVWHPPGAEVSQIHAGPFTIISPWGDNVAAPPDTEPLDVAHMRMPKQNAGNYSPNTEHYHPVIKLPPPTRSGKKTSTSTNTMPSSPHRRTTRATPNPPLHQDATFSDTPHPPPSPPMPTPLPQPRPQPQQHSDPQPPPHNPHPTPHPKKNLPTDGPYAIPPITNPPLWDEATEATFQMVVASPTHSLFQLPVGGLQRPRLLRNLPRRQVSSMAQKQGGPPRNA